MEKLKQLTTALLSLTKEAEAFYIDVVKQDKAYEVDFYGKVKPFADRVQPLAQEWASEVKPFLMQHYTKLVHISQVEQTVENLDVVAIKSFYPSSGMRRQRETFKSVRFVLENVLEEIKIAQAD
ncbi:DUF1798 family protein [Shouchella sp. JSM 1781072]|uniref:DUF1798 family protein n=1 Tax=Bacillaceae TaxID=186817 RepID=UPI000C08A273|nr:MULTISPECIES: DUF1798 family protein [Bacillaceae]UTR08344.1 YppE family protein [Alkalihalobacillus sp. LMS6]